MNRRFVFAIAAVCAATVVVAASAWSFQEEPKKPAGQQPQMPDDEQMKAMMEGMQKWMASMKPSKHHAKLDQFVGTWDTVMRMYMGGPGAPPAEAKGTSEMKWVLGKRFLLHEHKGEALMPDMTGAMKPMPFEGTGLTGYDNLRNMYVANWADTMSTQMLVMKGAADPEGKVFTYYGEMDEPMLNVVGRYVKYVTRVVNEDKFVFEIYDLHAGDGYKAVDITYTRKK